eukprot:m51a1_g13404 hypothetical protein (134) ;mRNA; f:27970-28695
MATMRGVAVAVLVLAGVCSLVYALAFPTATLRVGPTDGGWSMDSGIIYRVTATWPEVDLVTAEGKKLDYTVIIEGEAPVNLRTDEETRGPINELRNSRKVGMQYECWYDPQMPAMTTTAFKYASWTREFRNRD